METLLRMISFSSLFWLKIFMGSFNFTCRILGFFWFLIKLWVFIWSVVQTTQRNPINPLLKRRELSCLFGSNFSWVSLILHIKFWVSFVFWKDSKFGDGLCRGDQGFCSVECRNRQMALDEIRELESSTKRMVKSYRNCWNDARHETRLILKDLQMQRMKSKPIPSNQNHWAIVS